MTSVVFNDRKVKKMMADILKSEKEIGQRSRQYAGVLSARVLSDIFDHFKKEQGPNGSWKAWSPQYTQYMSAIGKGGNKILQDTGRLRSGWQPTNYTATREGFFWFNPVRYSRAHDQGSREENLPARPFAWLSKDAMKKIADDTLQFMIKKR